MGLAKLKIETLSTPEDYLNFEREADSRHEFIDGEIYAMAGAIEDVLKIETIECELNLREDLRSC